MRETAGLLESHSWAAHAAPQDAVHTVSVTRARYALPIRQRATCLDHSNLPWGWQTNENMTSSTGRHVDALGLRTMVRPSTCCWPGVPARQAAMTDWAHHYPGNPATLVWLTRLAGWPPAKCPVTSVQTLLSQTEVGAWAGSAVARNTGGGPPGGKIVVGTGVSGSRANKRGSGGRQYGARGHKH